MSETVYSQETHILTTYRPARGPDPGPRKALPEHSQSTPRALPEHPKHSQSRVSESRKTPPGVSESLKTPPGASESRKTRRKIRREMRSMVCRTKGTGWPTSRGAAAFSRLSFTSATAWAFHNICRCLIWTFCCSQADFACSGPFPHPSHIPLLYSCPHLCCFDLLVLCIASFSPAI